MPMREGAVANRSTLAPFPRANVLGVGVKALNLDTATEHITQALVRRAKGNICVTGVHGVSEAQADPTFRRILNQAFLNTPDGMPMVWLGRLQGFKTTARVYGPDLMLRICEVSCQGGFTHFFYGGAAGVGEQLKNGLLRQFPKLKVVGTFSPP